MLLVFFLASYCLAELGTDSGLLVHGGFSRPALHDRQHILVFLVLQLSVGQRGIDQQNAISMIVNGFCKEVFKQLPLEFAMEVQKLMEINLE